MGKPRHDHPTPAGTGQPDPEDAPSRNRPDQGQGPRTNRSARRTFTTEFKHAIVYECDAASNGTKGSILRRERLYGSRIQEWRAAVKTGVFEKKSAAPCGRPKNSAEQSEIAQLAKALAAERAAYERTRG
ncbi:hypothetical protein ACIPVK_07220 [Paeniglutamicibacter sp. MACA_103]|uniref:hypothetical protein n=1 Tax=Paeniglutamicibacter sp. MACA_103 TaxID=3377337 RepID=UPI003895E80F